MFCNTRSCQNSLACLRMVPGCPWIPQDAPNCHPDLRQTTFSYKADFPICYVFPRFLVCTQTLVQINTSMVVFTQSLVQIFTSIWVFTQTLVLFLFLSGRTVTHRSPTTHQLRPSLSKTLSTSRQPQGTLRGKIWIQEFTVNDFLHIYIYFSCYSNCGSTTKFYI